MGIIDILAIVIPSTMLWAAPLIFTALGGTFSERSGVVNIGLEGLMVIGAFTAIVFNLTFVSTFGDMTPWVSLLSAMVVGALLAVFHAVASITFRADQVVSGVAINLLALGAALFLVKFIYGKGSYIHKSNPIVLCCPRKQVEMFTVMFSWCQAIPSLHLHI